MTDVQRAWRRAVNKTKLE